MGIGVQQSARNDRGDGEGAAPTVWVAEGWPLWNDDGSIFGEIGWPRGGLSNNDGFNFRRKWVAEGWHMTLRSNTQSLGIP